MAHAGITIALCLVAATAPADRQATPAPAHRQRAVAAWRRGEAETTLQHLRAGRLTSPAARLLAARAWARLGRLGEALRVLDPAPVKGRLGDHVLEARARLAARLGLHLRAVADLDRLIRRRGSVLVDRARVLRAEELWLAGAYLHAAAAYRDLRRRFPHYPSPARFLHGEARALLLAGRPEAAALWRRLIRDYPAAPEAAEAARILARLPGAKPLSPEERRQRAEHLGKSGDLPGAQRILATLVKQKELTQSAAWLLEARIRMRTYQYPQAVPLLERVRKRGTPADKARAQALLPRALARSDQLEQLLKLTRRRPGRAARRRRARVQLMRGDYLKAERLLRRLGPADARGFFAAYLAFRVGAKAKGAYARAEQRLRQLEERPGLERAAAYWRARTWMAQGRARQARRRLTRLATGPRADWYTLMARLRLREDPARPEPAAVPLSPLSLPEGRRRQRLAQRLAQVGRKRPGLDRAARLLRFGLVDRALSELRAVARGYLLGERGGRRAATLRPISPAEAWRGARHRAGLRPRRPIAAPGTRSEALERLLYATFQELGDPYFANRFTARDRGRPRIALARPFPRLVQSAARENGLTPGQLWAVMTVESAWCPQVVSHAGAVGLLQLMPLTARRVARSLALPRFHLADLFAPRTSIRLGAWYLGQLLRRFQGQYALAVAAYNGGPHNVAAWLRRKAGHADLDEFVEEIPLRETRLYVKKVVGLAARYAIARGEPYADIVRLQINPTARNNIDY